MYVDFRNITSYGITPHGVIHVGMHTAEEYPVYKECGVKHIVYIEANKQLANKYAPNDPDCFTIHAAVSDKFETVEFNVSNNLASSSILELGDHSVVYPGIVFTEKVEMITSTLDKILSDIDLNISLLNVLTLDIQGAELKAMKGLSNWDYIEAVYTEVNYREMYIGCPLVNEIDLFLLEKGLVKVEEVDTGCGWGDALYVKKV